MNLKNADQERPHVCERRLELLENPYYEEVVEVLIDAVLTLDKRLATVEKGRNTLTVDGRDRCYA